MSESCYYCAGPVNPYDAGTYHQQSVWVHGPKRNGATLKEETGKVAHEACVIKAKAGHPPEQMELI